MHYPMDISKNHEDQLRIFMQNYYNEYLNIQLCLNEVLSELGAKYQ